MDRYDLDIGVTRGAAVESRHRVHAAVVDAEDRLVAGAGDPRAVSFWRSCAKPFQVMPLVASAGLEALHWGDDELALACASHGGEPEHVLVAESMLRDVGLEEGDLACGVHEPLSARGLRLAREGGARLRRVHNNCSGKHAAMLARARLAGWPTVGYERHEHPVQRAVVEVVATWTSLAPASIPWAVDGCGVPVFALEIERMARAYARLAAASARGDEVPARIVNAMRARPFLVGGTDRFDSVLIEETQGRIISKVGAEGVHSAAVPDLGLGLAIKVEDGAQRAQYPALLRLLQLVGALPEALPTRLAEYLRKPVRTTRNEVVGEIAPIVS